MWIGWLKYLSFIFYGFGLLLHIEYQNREIYRCCKETQYFADKQIGRSLVRLGCQFIMLLFSDAHTLLPTTSLR